MAEPNTRDAKLVQYLNEAYAKEKELEISLQAHIGMTPAGPRKAYKNKLQEHLKETKSHGKQLERRIKKLGGGAGALDKPREAVATGAGKAAAAAKGGMASAKGALHAARGTSEEEMLLKNAKTQYFNEHEEIATYSAIETLADEVNDKETAKLARDIRRDEEKMARYLERQIPTLTKAVVKTEVPAAERRKPSSKRRSSRSKSRSSSGSSSRSSSRGQSRSKSGGRKKSTTKSS